MGSQFLPQIGQEVLVKFIEGDIDRPVIVGALYNGQGEGHILPTPGGVTDRDSDRLVFERAHGACAARNSAAGATTCCCSTIRMARAEYSLRARMLRPS